MRTALGFPELLHAAERHLVEGLCLRQLHPDPARANAVGLFKGAEVRLETRVYAGRDRWARFVTIRGGELAIGNLLAAAHPRFGLPVLGADLVDFGRETGVIAADISPLVDALRDEQLAALAPTLATAALPSAGPVPAWCAPWFSPFALFAKVGPGDRGAAGEALDARCRAFVALASSAEPRPAHEGVAREGLARYARSHREEDRGLLLLQKMFDPTWARSYLAEFLFPDEAPVP